MALFGLGVTALVISTIIAALAAAWFIKPIRALLFTYFVKLEAERLEHQEVKELQDKIGLTGEINTGELLREKDDIAAQRQDMGGMLGQALGTNLKEL